MAQIRANDGDTPLVLVVEDDEDLREVLELFLDSIGIRHISASNGREALAALSLRAPALILLDMRMPVMDGWAFARELRALKGHAIPLVVMSAAEDIEACARSVGAEAHAAKPFELHAMEATLRRVLPAPHLASHAP
jgi:CheY-like chemotaxis protein